MNTSAMGEAIKGIARTLLFLETLETSNSRADFTEQSVWGIKNALEAAYKAGANSAISNSEVKVANTTAQFDPEQLSVMNLFDNATLSAVVRGELDLNALAKQHLAGRGYNEHGVWVGFKQAKRLAAK